MAAKGTGEIPIGLRRVCRRFERWRNGHKARLPIPAPLWSAATDAAKEFGVFQAANDATPINRKNGLRREENAPCYRPTAMG